MLSDSSQKFNNIENYCIQYSGRQWKNKRNRNKQANEENKQTMKWKPQSKF